MTMDFDLNNWIMDLSFPWELLYLVIHCILIFIHETMNAVYNVTMVTRYFHFFNIK